MARDGAVAAVLPGGEVLVAGGYSPGPGEVSTAEVFNPGNDTFSKLTGSGQSLNEAREDAVAATLPSGQILIAGGINKRSEHLSSAELFDPGTDTFSTLSGSGQSLTVARASAVATTLPSGEVLIAGGAHGGTLSSAELFNPATDTFTMLTGSGASLTEAREGAIAMTLPSGEAVIAGGRANPGEYRSTAELFNPTTDTFSKLTGSGESPIQAREGAVAAVLPAGQVLIAGGGPQLSSAELFFPAKLAAEVGISGGGTSATVGDTEELAASSSSKVDPIISSATPSVCTLSPSQINREQPPGHSWTVVNFDATGTCKILAKVEATAEYEAAEASKSFTVGNAVDGIRKSALELSRHPSVDHKNAAVMLKAALGGSGTLRWTLTYKDPSGSEQPFGRGTETVRSATVRAITVKPNAATLRMVKRARKHGHGLSVKAVLIFTPTSGSPVRLQRSILVRLG